MLDQLRATRAVQHFWFNRVQRCTVQLSTCCIGDPTLAMWSKREEPVLPMPPPDMPLVGWRDPFIFETKGKQGNGREWGMLMGSGLKGQGGAIMIYRSESLCKGKHTDNIRLRMAHCCHYLTLCTSQLWLDSTCIGVPDAKCHERQPQTLWTIQLWFCQHIPFCRCQHTGFIMAFQLSCRLAL